MLKRKQKTEQITLGSLSIKLTRKNVKNINLRVYPSRQEVRMSAPHHISTRSVREFAASKHSWIQNKLSNYKSPAHINEPKFVSGETHLYQGHPLRLIVSTRKAKPEVWLNESNKTLKMVVRPGSGKAKRARVLDEWYRVQLKKQIPRLIEKWEAPMKVTVHEFGVKKMKTRWGSCNTRDHRIWLNLELAKKSADCLEYVVVHEMVHLLERLHNHRFYSFMDQLLPGWQKTEKELQGKVD